MTTEIASSPRKPWYRLSLTAWIMIGLVVGGFIGWIRPDWGNKVYFLRDIFLNLIKSVIAPLVFSTLVVGIAGGGDLKKVGRMGAKALLYFEIVTTIALFIGLLVVNLTKPGVGVALAAPVTETVQKVAENHPKTLIETIVHIFPASIVDAMVRGDVLQIVAFAVLFAHGRLRHRREGQADRARDGEPVADHVPLHQLRDDVRADRRRRGHGPHHRHARPRGCWSTSAS